MPQKNYPASDSRFHYIPSQNPYWSKIKNLNHPRLLIDHDTESLKGQWKKKFQVTGKLRVEIGCNGGHWLLGQAKETPNDFLIGIDWKFKQIYFAFEKSEKKEIQNIALLRANAERLPFIFERGEIDELYLFFPDPWPKDAQQKKRLFQKEWLESIAPLFSKDGTFTIKTDHPGYFEAMLEELQTVKESWSVLEKNSDLYANHPNAEKLAPPEVTLFERVFILEKKPIQFLKLKPQPL